MSIKAISWAFDQQTGSPTTKLILIKLADNANDDGECWPSQKYISKHTELSRESVNRHIKKLEASKLLTVIRRKKEGVSLPNKYILHTQGVVSESHKGSDGESQGVVSESHTNRKIEPSIEPTVSPNGSTGKNKKVEKFNGKEYHEPTTVKEFKEYCSRSTQEHVRMIGYIAEKSGASYTTSGEWAEYFAAQKKWTAKCVMFSHARIKEALEHAIEKYDEWNAHSIYKALTNQKKKTPKPAYY